MKVRHAEIFLENVEKRLTYVYFSVAKICQRKVAWFDYDTSEDGSKGYFDRKRYSENILLTGSFENKVISD